MFTNAKKSSLSCAFCLNAIIYRHLSIYIKYRYGCENNHKRPQSSQDILQISFLLKKQAKAYILQGW